MSVTELIHPGINIGATEPETHAKAEPIMFGFWVFLMSDLVMFSLLLATYAAMSVHGDAGGPTPAQASDLWTGGGETALLLCSSFTFGMASLALKYRSGSRKLLFWLGVTALLGLGFLGLESYDFISLGMRGAGPETSGFLSARFTLLGMHFLHVSSGLVWMGILAVQVKLWGPEGIVRLRIMRLALFWHMLDVVWIALFSFVFVAGGSL